MKVRYHFVVLLVGAAVLMAPGVVQAAATPVRNTQFRAFNQQSIKVEAALVMDAASGQLLYTYHADWQWPLASVTKLMTSLIYTEQQPNWDATIAMSAEDEVGGGRLRVTSGSQLSKRDLLYCAVVGSANNTATAMMRTSGMTTQQFLGRMNQRAQELGMTQASFADASGMAVENRATAYDAAKLAVAAFNQPDIQRAAQTGKYTFVIRSTGEVKNIVSTDKLLTNDSTIYVVGGKTGYLEESKNNFVAQLRPMVQPKNRKGDVVVVVFGSPTKDTSFAAAKTLAQWAWKVHEWPQVAQVVRR